MKFVARGLLRTFYLFPHLDLLNRVDFLRLDKSLAKILDQVGGIFKADRDAHGSRTYSSRTKLHLGHIVVRSVNRQDYERLDTTQARRQQEDSHAIAESPRRRKPAFQIESEHCAESFHLPFG